MNHKDLLKLIFPVPDLGGVFDQDVQIEGGYLDELQAAAALLVNEFFPNTTNYLLEDWERVYRIIPPAGATMQTRREALLQKVRAVGGITRAYFISLAATVGYTITIEELPPNAPTYGPESIFRWICHVANADTLIRYFTAGDSLAGDYLTDWSTQEILEGIITDLKPAHTEVAFVYEG